MSNRTSKTDWIALAMAVAVVVALIYPGVAWQVFRWRNPTANDMAFYRDFMSVMKFQRLDKYQGNQGDRR